MQVLIPILMNDSASHIYKSKKIILDIKNYMSMEGRRVVLPTISTHCSSSNLTKLSPSQLISKLLAKASLSRSTIFVQLFHSERVLEDKVQSYLNNKMYLS